MTDPAPSPAPATLRPWRRDAASMAGAALVAFVIVDWGLGPSLTAACTAAFALRVDIPPSDALATIVDVGSMWLAIGAILAATLVAFLVGRVTPTRTRRAAAVVAVAAGVTFAATSPRGSGSPGHAHCEAGLAGYQPETQRHATPHGGDPAFVATHNSLGLRGPEVVDGVPIVLMVGDSFTYGTGVGDEDTVAARLGARLDGFQVVNAGFEGDNLAGVLERARRWVERLGPTVLIVGLYGNDLASTSTTALCELPAWCRPSLPFAELDGLATERARVDPDARARELERAQAAWRALEPTLERAGIGVVVLSFGGDIDPTILRASALRMAHERNPCRPDADVVAHPDPVATACIAQRLEPAVRRVLE